MSKPQDYTIIIHTKRQIRIVQTINELQTLHFSEQDIWITSYFFWVCALFPKIFWGFFCVFASFNADWNPAHQIPSYDILLMPVSPRGVAHEIYCTDFCSTKWLSQSRMQGSSPARPLLEAEKGRGRSGGLLPDSQGKDGARKSPGFTTPSIPAWLCSSLARTIVGHQCLFLCFLYL